MKGAPPPACLMVTLRAPTGLRMPTVFMGVLIPRRTSSIWGVLGDRVFSPPISPGISRELARVSEKGVLGDG